MWNTQTKGGKREALRQNEEKKGRLSCTMAMVLGVFVTMEIMVAGAMVLNYDFRGGDGIAVVFAFMVLYFGVVALLTDK